MWWRGLYIELYCDTESYYHRFFAVWGVAVACTHTLPWSHALWCMMCVLLCGRTNWAWCESGKFQVGRCRRGFFTFAKSAAFEPTRLSSRQQQLSHNWSRWQFNFAKWHKKKNAQSLQTIQWPEKLKHCVTIWLYNVIQYVTSDMYKYTYSLLLALMLHHCS